MRLAPACLIVFLASSLCVAQENREKDVYAIYSLLMTNPETSHGPDDNPRYLILDTTVAGVPAEPCVNAAGERAERMAEIRKDFQERRKQQRKLKRELKLSKPYELLAEPESRQRARSAGVTDVFSFSDVYFDKAGTLALTHRASICGSLCALFQWKLLEKQSDGSWKEVPGVGCVAMAQNRAGSPYNVRNVALG